MLRFCLVATTLVLTLPALADAARPEPTSGTCGRAWNRSPAVSVITTVQRARARQATVKDTRGITGAVVFGRAGGSVTTSHAERGCVISFFLPDGRSITVTGSWIGGTVANWTAPIVRQASSNASGNACVSGGKVFQIGRFNAAARCP